MELKAGYKQTEVGVIPEEWSTPQVCELGVIVTGGTPRTEVRAFWNGDYPWVTPTDISVGRDMYTSERKLTLDGLKSIRRLPANSVLVTCIASIGKNAILRAEGGCNQQINAVIPNRDNSAEFLYYLFEASKQYLLANAGTTATSILSKALFAELVFPVPPLPEQRVIATALSDVDALIASLDQLIAKKRDLKLAAMQRLLIGKTRLPGFTGEWEVKKFGDIAILRKDRIDPHRSDAQGFCVELEHIEPETGRLLGSTSTSDNSSLKSLFQVGDVLFGKLRAYLRKYWLADRAGVCSTEIWVLIPHASVITGAYLFQLVTQDHFIETASTAYGTHMPRSDWNVVKNYQVTLPGREEQTAIAVVLSDMDAEIAALEARRDKTRAIKQGMMQELLTGRIRLV